MIFVIFVNLLVDIIRWLYVVVQDNKRDVGERFSEMKRRSSNSISMSRKSLSRSRASSLAQDAIVRDSVVISPLTEQEVVKKMIKKETVPGTDVELTSLSISDQTKQKEGTTFLTR